MPTQENQTNYKITVVYNNVTGEHSHNLNRGFGFSAFVEFKDEAILFDTGGDYVNLEANMESLKVDYTKMKTVFISHNHWDHVYGIPTAMGASKGKAKVYAPSCSAKSILEQYPRMIIEGVAESRELFPDIWTTGEMECTYRNITFAEQSLIIVKGDDLYVITGCSHPGIVEILEKVKSMFPEKNLKFVMGGFHLNRKTEEELSQIVKRFKELGVKKVAPTHCTGEDAIKFFQEEFGDDFVEMHLGDSFEF